VLAPVGNGDLRRALRRDVAIVSGKRMGRKALHQSSTLHPADSGAPFMAGKRVRQARRESVSGVAPEVFRMVLAVDGFFVIEFLDGRSLLAIRKARKHVRQAEA